MNEIRLVLTVMASLSLATGSNVSSASEETNTLPAIVPQPQECTVLPGEYQLQSNTTIYVDRADGDIAAIAVELSHRLSQSTGYTIATDSTTLHSYPRNAIVLTQRDADTELGEEGYELEVRSGIITLRAVQPAGLFYGAQTLRQLFPIDIENTEPPASNDTKWTIPCVRIVDRPRYPWRGVLLDPCRHFLSKEAVLQFIERMAFHKLNVLHLHLTDDEGWRIEIKNYPELTEKAAWVTYTNGEKYGGYYTQNDIREIVTYARQHYIQVVPEIESPGHGGAVLAVMPQLHCTGHLKKVPNLWLKDEPNNGRSYCAGNDDVYTFLENVWAEVLELFPSPDVHIGGDEAQKDFWAECPKCQARMKAEGLSTPEELQSYFVKRIERFLHANGRRIIGWDEILDGGIAPNAVVQSYRGMQGGIEAARQNHDAIMSPSAVYFDLQLTQVDLRAAYEFDPTPPELEAERRPYIIGSECCLWSEFIPEEMLDPCAYPRLLGFAESLWTASSERDYDAFFKRIQIHARRLERMGIQMGSAEYQEAQAVIPATAHVDMARPYDFPDGARYFLETFQPLRAFDGDHHTFCLTVGPQKDQGYTLTFDTPQSYDSIEVQTGLLDGHYRLRHGVLEISEDGETFESIAEFENGTARGMLPNTPLKAIRLRSTEDEDIHYYLAIREIVLERDGKNTLRTFTPLERLSRKHP